MILKTKKINIAYIYNLELLIQQQDINKTKINNSFPITNRYLHTTFIESKKQISKTYLVPLNNTIYRLGNAKMVYHGKCFLKHHIYDEFEAYRMSMKIRPF